MMMGSRGRGGGGRDRDGMLELPLEPEARVDERDLGELMHAHGHVELGLGRERVAETHHGRRHCYHLYSS